MALFNCNVSIVKLIYYNKVTVSNHVHVRAKYIAEIVLAGLQFPFRPLTKFSLIVLMFVAN